MKTVMATAALTGVLLAFVGEPAVGVGITSQVAIAEEAVAVVAPAELGSPAAGAHPPDAPLSEVVHAPMPERRSERGTVAVTPATLTEVVQRYCLVCHNDALLTGNLSLTGFDVDDAPARPETAERMILKLRAGMMPPPGMPRPGGDTLTALVETLEARMDAAAASNPNPGTRSFQRLNRAEYERSINDILDLDVDAGDYLPLDTKSANFDNIADAQMLSPTLLDAYLNAAGGISRLALGDAAATASESQYRVSRWASQTDRVAGAPYGTRGGISVVHNFPADGEYVFRVSFHHETTGTLVGNGRNALHTTDAPEQLEVSINGERAAVLELDRWMHVSDPDGVSMRTEPVFVRAGPQRVSAAFIRHAEGPVQDLVSPHDWSLASTAIAGTYGLLALPHLRDLVIGGPFSPTGVSETPSRRAIFTCRPTSAEQEKACAEEIISTIAPKAFRRPITADDLEALMGFYALGSEEGGFEAGIGTALEAILASPHFVFRFEEPPEGADPERGYRISDIDLASRLSFFLWGTLPDDELMSLASAGRLSDPDVLDAQLTRMLADSRTEALGSRFAAQWLRLQDLEKINPDVRLNPDFYQQLRESMLRETELFFYDMVREDKSVLDLYSADYTFVDERLARHYGIPNVTGNHFRRVSYPDDSRRGLFGHGSILTLTSHAGRTSPVLRGKWVMEVLLGTPPPPPPPGIPDLEETESSEAGRMLTTRERMEKHRANPVCNACHQFMDPIGLSLDNFDVTGKWRIRENGMPLDTQGQLYDGTPISSPAELQQALLKRPAPLIRTFTANLMAYALGRRVEYYDQPAIRGIVREGAANDYRISSFVRSVIQSDAFQMTGPEPAVTDRNAGR